MMNESKILGELNTLDREVSRVEEDIIQQLNIEVHKSKIDVINRKNELREQLKNL